MFFEQVGEALGWQGRVEVKPPHLVTTPFAEESLLLGGFHAFCDMVRLKVLQWNYFFSGRGAMLPCTTRLAKRQPFGVRTNLST